MAVFSCQSHAKEIKGIFPYLSIDISTLTTGSDFLIGGGYVLPLGSMGSSSDRTLSDNGRGLFKTYKSDWCRID